VCFKHKLPLLLFLSWDVWCSAWPVSFTLAWFSWEFVAESRIYGDQLLNDLPAWLFQSIMPVAFFLIGYRYSIWFLRRVRILLSSKRE
jgi:hypothetical protein